MLKRSERVIDYSVYKDGATYMGTATADLPEITYLSDTIKGGGINGEMEAPSPGQTGAMTLTLNWRTLEAAVIGLAAPVSHTLDLRASIQGFDPATGQYTESSIKITVKGRPLSMTPGSLEPAATMNAANAFALSYIKIVIDGIVALEIDKYNYIHIVNGVDYLARTRANLGM